MDTDYDLARLATAPAPTPDQSTYHSEKSENHTAYNVYRAYLAIPLLFTRVRPLCDYTVILLSWITPSLDATHTHAHQ